MKSILATSSTKKGIAIPVSHRVNFFCLLSNDLRTTFIVRGVFQLLVVLRSLLVSS